ncbi:MAG: Nif3-like dinuclear metal center hexameric protein [Clostridium sp.]|nr:Nif3-like dinuclear metal center hexameric protein [Clostridium sp.]MCM1400123.1 Nif3-like dinuclear metal center hexameric protein [Clostridium sp.]MCM1460810.1 Nif3-like dinuclear metal center hexameric protein [Bacteroides sp.]
MLCSDIIRILESQSPTEYAMEWDNVGLLVGRKNKEIKKIMLAVDATADVCQLAIDKGADMIITHHPMIFSKIRRVNDDTVLGNKILSLIEAGIVCYAMHTNFDTKGGMAKEAAKMLALKNTEVLEETCNGEGIGQIGILKTAATLGECAKKVKEVFDVEHVMVFGDGNKIIEKIAVCPGSGKSVIDVAIQKKADCLITGDIGHHDGLDAMEAGLSIIDASHYGVEKLFLRFMYHYLVDFCDGVEIEIVDVGTPFYII